MCFDKLAALGREFEAALAAIEQFDASGIEDDARMGTLSAARDAIAERIIQAPALHAGHVAIKAHVAATMCPSGDSIEERAMRSLIVAVSDVAL